MIHRRTTEEAMLQTLQEKVKQLRQSTQDIRVKIIGDSSSKTERFDNIDRNRDIGIVVIKDSLESLKETRKLLSRVHSNNSNE